MSLTEITKSQRFLIIILETEDSDHIPTDVGVDPLNVGNDDLKIC